MDVRWTEWLTKRARTWAGMALSLLTVALITGAALVGATADAPDPTEEPSLVVEDPSEEAAEVEEDVAEEDVTEDAGENAEAKLNHGHCVSQATKAAKDAGLEGKAKGTFVSSIAQDPAMLAVKDELGPECDFAEALAAAVEAQAADDALEPDPSESVKGKHGKLKKTKDAGEEG